MVAPIIASDAVKPTIELAMERFETDWPSLWLTYGVDRDDGWKDLEISSLYVRLERLGRVHYRCYRLRARKLNTAIERLTKILTSPFPCQVTIYRFSPPPSKALVAHLECVNLRLQAESQRRHEDTNSQSSITNRQSQEVIHVDGSDRRRDPVRRSAEFNRPVARGYQRHPQSCGLSAGR